MLKRALTLHGRKRKATDDAGAEPRSARPKCQLNLKESPLMRWAAKKVGQGNPASLFQEVAQACIEETAAASGGSSGLQLVTESCSIAESCRHVFMCCCRLRFAT